MNCYTHSGTPAVGICAACQRAVCRECVARDTPRLLCTACADGAAIYGYEYRSSATLGDWPLVHICAGIDPATMRPKVAKGVIAIGNIAVGGLAIGGAAAGLFTIGGAAFGLLFAAGGAALGLGISVGGLAVGSIAVGGLAIGYSYAVGGVAFGPAVIDGTRCDAAARDFFARWVRTSTLPPACRRRVRPRRVGPPARRRGGILASGLPVPF